MPTFNEPVRALEFLITEANGSISRDQVTIAAAAPAMVAGTVVAQITSGGQWTLYDNASGTAGVNVAAGILAYDVPDSAGTQTATIIRRHAEVKAGLLNWGTNDGAGITAGTADLATHEILVRAA
jgi:hypothetical protein